MSVSLFSNSLLSINGARNGGNINVIDSSIGISIQYFILHEFQIGFLSMKSPPNDSNNDVIDNNIAID